MFRDQFRNLRGGFAEEINATFLQLNMPALYANSGCFNVLFVASLECLLDCRLV